MDRGVWRATVHGVGKSRMQLSMHTGRTDMEDEDASRVWSYDLSWGSFSKRRSPRASSVSYTPCCRKGALPAPVTPNRPATWVSLSHWLGHRVVVYGNRINVALKVNWKRQEERIITWKCKLFLIWAAPQTLWFIIDCSAVFPSKISVRRVERQSPATFCLERFIAPFIQM